MNATETAYASAADLESALRRAEAAHREHEKRTWRSHLFHRSDQDENWLDWYAAYMVAEQAGTDLPSCPPVPRLARPPRLRRPGQRGVDAD